MTSETNLNENYSEIQAIVRSILVTNANNGSTIQEIRDQYYELTGEKFPYMENITNFLLQIKGIICYVNSNGTRIFHLIKSEKSQHILTMVQNQKKPTKKSYKQQNNNYQSSYQAKLLHSSFNEMEADFSNLEFDSGIPFTRPDNSNNNNCNRNNMNNNEICYFKDNYQYNRMNKYQHFTENSLNSRQTGILSTITEYLNNNYENNFVDKNSAHLYDYQLMGDDFFLSMAKMELGCKLKRKQNILQSGLCISGLTLRKAIKLVNTLPYINPNIIVNVGSVDILNGRELVEIEYDFRNLKEAFKRRGITPIFTTLAPLGNSGHKCERYILERFNEYMKRNTDINVIDIWTCMVNQQGQTLYECYQFDARYVSGSDKPHVLWNKIGRQRILKKIKSEIELFPY